MHCWDTPEALLGVPCITVSGRGRSSGSGRDTTFSSRKGFRKSAIFRMLHIFFSPKKSSACWISWMFRMLDDFSFSEVPKKNYTTSTPSTKSCFSKPFLWLPAIKEKIRNPPPDVMITSIDVSIVPVSWESQKYPPLNAMQEILLY